VEGDRKILIVTDDETLTQELARKIASVITFPSFGDYSVSVLKSGTFFGTDILPVHAFFLGCSLPSPSTFTYIDMLFRRINLAGRPCGVFSSNSKALRYLSSTVRVSEVSMGRPLLAKDGKTDDARLLEWVKNTLEPKGRQ